MKNWLIRLQILLILLVFASPVLYLVIREYSPQITLARYDQDRIAREKSYPHLKFLQISGRHIVDQDNKPIVLRGVNIASTTWGPEYEIWNPQAVEYVTTHWGANVIRTRIHQYEFDENPANFFLKLEKQILEPARKNGAYVILHPWFGENQSIPDKNGEYMWLAVAKRYKDDPHLIYDIFAEPREVERSDLLSAYNSLIPKIREVAPSSLIFVTGLDWGREINSFLASPLPFPNLVYRTNPYNKTGEFEGLFGRIAESYPVFIGEFGTDTSLSMSLDDVRSLLGYANNLNLGWTSWHFSASGCPCLLTSNDNFTPSEYGNVVKDALSGTVSSYPKIPFNNDPSRLYVYSDYLDHGFTDYTWLTKASLQSKPALVGQFSFSTSLGNAAGIYFHTSDVVNPSDYTSLKFMLKTQDPSALTLRLRDSKDQFSPTFALVDYYDYGHSIATIPLNDVKLADIAGISLEPSQELVEPIPVTIDEMYFAK